MVSAETVPMIDWGPVDRVGVPEDEITCRCGAVYASHATIALAPPPDEHHLILVAVSRRPCPACGLQCNVRSVSSAWETWSL